MTATALYGRSTAIELWRRHELLVPVDLKRLASELGVEVVDFPFEGRMNEVIIGATVGVRPGLARPWFRWYVAHALGHHLMHVGDNFHLESWQWANHAKAESQAEEFAAWLLGGVHGWQHTAAELGVPPDKLPLVRAITHL